MDSLTHLVAGALTPPAFKNAPRTRLMTLFGILCGEFPDIDIIMGGSPEAILVLHRGITHSLILQPVFALVMALLFHGALKKRDAAGTWTFGKTWLVALAAMLIHLFLDCMTTFGTQIFLPFSTYRVAFPAMFIIDAFFTVPLLAVWIILMRKARVRRTARAALAWVIFYPLCCLAINYGLAAHLSARYAKPGNPQHIANLQLSPDPFSPLNWKVVAKTPDQYLMARYFLPRAGQPLSFTSYDRPNPAQWAKLQREVPLFAMYADFVSFPAQTVQPGPDGGSLITFFDVRYASTLPELMALLGREDGIFLMQAKLDAQGTLTAYRFLYRGREAPATPWQAYTPAGKT